MKLKLLDYASVTLIILKLTGVINWTWGQVLCLPLILAACGFLDGIIENFTKRKERD